MDSAFDGYEFSRACESLYHFAWDEFCDWYVELAKVQLRPGTVGHTTAVLAAVLDTLLKLLHPVMPFVTETLWKALTGGESSSIADVAGAVRDRAGSRCGAADRRHAEAGHRGPPVPQRSGPGRPAEGAGPAGRVSTEADLDGQVRRRDVAGVADRRRRRLQSDRVRRGAAVGRHGRRRTRHVGHRRRRRRAPPAGEGSGRRAEGTGRHHSANSATTPSWPRRPTMSSPRSATASSWPAKRSTGSRPRLAALA